MQILLTHDFQELNLELIQMEVLCFRKTELKKILGYAHHYPHDNVLDKNTDCASFV